MNKTKFLFLLVVAFGLLGVAMVWKPSIKTQREKNITSFEQCQAAGYPVMESYPRQCTVSSGKFFIEQIVASACTSDTSCGPSAFCNGGTCQAFTPETACKFNTDCKLINTSNRFACCWTGSCEAIDYSSAAWVAVNKNWFNGEQAANCPAQSSCDPRPLCASQAVNLRFAARCVSGVCAKVQTGYDE